MNNRTVIIQSNYIPWKGYFDLLSHADTVVMFDNVQSTKNDWRNRNIIKTHAGKTWLTIPTRHSNTLRVRDVEVASSGWYMKHFRSIQQAYARAPFAKELLPEIEGWYTAAGQLRHLSAINYLFIKKINQYLGIKCQLINVQDILSDEEHDKLEPSERLVKICQSLGTSKYLSGPAARNYLDNSKFQQAGVDVEWFDYDGYPEYPQLHGQFEHAVSIIDLILMNGKAAPKSALRPVTTFEKD